MKLPWFGRAKWQDPDPAVRLEAVASADDASMLAGLAESDPAAEVRLAAVGKLDDPDLLRRVACSASDVNAAALARLADPARIVQVARNAPSADVRMRALDRIDDRQVLQRVSSEDPDERVRRHARARLAGSDAMRGLLKTALTRLPISGAVDAVEGMCGSIDGVCAALAADRRFRVHGVVGRVNEREGNVTPVIPAGGSGLEAVVSGATVLELLGNKSVTAPESGDRFNLGSYYHIEIRRTAETSYVLSVTERESRSPFQARSAAPFTTAR